MNNVMIDLETMGTNPDAAIISIGAVAFDVDTRTIGEKFYRTIDLKSSVASGGKMDPDTVIWWMRQSEEAKEVFKTIYGDPPNQLTDVLHDFTSFLDRQSGIKYRYIWGCGAAFDNTILAETYRRCGLKVPWSFWNDRCYRTIKAFYPDIPIARSGTYHNALDDAEAQAKHLIRMMNPIIDSEGDKSPDETSREE